MSGRIAGRRWVPPEAVDEDDLRAMRESLSLPSPLCELLLRRGLRPGEEARGFLRPRLSALHPPGLLPDLSAAVDRLERAVRDGETVLVHGDYDVDGMAAAALLVRALRELGGRAEAFVPDRMLHGYDLGPAGLEAARSLGASVLVTVDCGVCALEAVRDARAAGVDVVVTDHHRPGPALPEALAVVNPHREDAAPPPFRALSGVGVAFKLVAELFARAGRPEERLNAHLDLVALGTVADQVPLVGENRILARMGLRALERTRKAGLRAVLDRVRDPGRGPLRAADIAFRVAPRLNAVGRVGTAAEGLRLLLTDDPAEAERLAGRLEAENTRRRAEDRRVVEEAERRLSDGFDPDRDRVVVLWADDWHPGVIGIAASRLVERFHRPAALIALDGDRGRGSARSVDGFHLYRALEACAPCLERYGGHEMAAGFDVRRDRLEEFRRRLLDHAGRELPDERLVPRLRLDLVLPVRAIDRELVRLLEHVGPFGSSNARPKIGVRRLELRELRRVGGEGRHLRAVAVDGDARLPVIGFGMGDREEEAASGPLEAVLEPRESWWRGRSRAEGRIVDLRPAGSGLEGGG